jgi:hypothetical protein
MTLCARVGPFSSEDADSLIAALPAYITLLSDVSEEYARVDGYYVLIPTLASRAAGIRKLEELDKAGVKDTWLFRAGELENAISLGLFRREAGARRRAQNVAKKGFTTEVKERTSVQQRRWLYLKSHDGGELRASLPLTGDVSVEPQACP